MWLVEYADGATFSNEDGEPWEAPRTGVQMVYYTDSSVGVVAEKSPHVGVWVWKVDGDGDNGRWFGLDDMWAYWQYVFTYTRSPVIALFGEMLHDHDYEEHARRVIAKHFGIEKNNWTHHERRRP